MQIVFYITAVAGLLYFICKKRSFDHLAILYFSGIVYCLHAFVGHVESVKGYGYFYLEVTPYAYLTLTVYFGTVLAGTIFYDLHFAEADRIKHQKNLDKALPEYRDYAIALNLLTAILCFSFLQRSPEIILRSIDKLEFMEELGRSHTLFQLSAILGMIASVLSRKRSLILIAAGMLCLDVYIGFRSGFALAAIGVIMVLAERTPPAPLYQKWRLIGIGSVVVAFTFVIKRFYKAIKSGDALIMESSYDYVVNRPLEMILNSEPQAVMLMYLASLENEVKVDFQYVANQFIGMIPLGPQLGFNVQDDFNDIVQESVLGISQDTVGLGMSSLGEWHAIGGLTGLACLAGILVTLIIGLGFLKHKSIWLHPPCLLLMNFLAFYSYRNGLFQILKFSRNAILLSVVVVAFAFLLKAFSGLQSTRRRPSRQMHSRRRPRTLRSRM